MAVAHTCQPWDLKLQKIFSPPIFLLPRFARSHWNIPYPLLFFSHFSPFSPLFGTGIHFINSLINKDYYNMTELCTVTSNFYAFLGESTLETTKKVPFTPKCLPQIFWGCFQGDSGRFMKCRRNAEEGTEIRESPWQSGRVDRSGCN